jgi:probable RNA-binding protein EIF1AD
MAGLGRRTHYRKHLTDSVLNDLPEPKEDERIAKVVSTRGGNQFDIVLATSVSGASNNGIIAVRTPQLAILPTKFHKLVWVKRNDYVIVQTGTLDDDDDDNSEGKIDGTENDEPDKDAPTMLVTKELDHHQGGIRYIITHILYKDQVKHLRVKGLWPEGDPEFDGSTAAGGPQPPVLTDLEGEQEADDDGIVYNEYDNENDDDLFVNTNRVARLEIQDSDDDEASSEDED